MDRQTDGPHWQKVIRKKEMKIYQYIHHILALKSEIYQNELISIICSGFVHKFTLSSLSISDILHTGS